MIGLAVTFGFLYLVTSFGDCDVWCFVVEDEGINLEVHYLVPELEIFLIIF